MVWRICADGASAPPQAGDRRAAMAGLVQDGQQVGILGYDAGTPVAWCSIAPRSLFGTSLSNSQPEPGLWSLTCFFIRADHRKQSGFAALLGAAESFATKAGATTIEAYPVAADSPSYRFSGYLPAFEAAGYALIDTVGMRRHVVRKLLAV